MNVREIFMRQRQKALEGHAGAAANRSPECAEPPPGHVGKVISATSATSATCSSLRVGESAGNITAKSTGKEVAKVAEVASIPMTHPAAHQDRCRPAGEPASSHSPPTEPAMPPACPLPGEPLVTNLKEVFLP